jgi:hypothetical protein
MDEPSEQLFSRAALSQQQHGRITRCRSPRHINGGLHFRALADNQMIPIATLFGENFDFPFQRLSFDRFANNQLDMIGIERPGDEIVRPRFHDLDRAVDRAVCGYQDHRRVVAFVAKLFKHIEATQIRHHVVENHQVRRRGLNLRYCFFASAGRIDDKSFVNELLLQNFSIGRLVVRD